ncbi:hypothetical protein CDIK_3842 [Cucumispora dikerogammari]|nr:hypothetical protein CDIK_3842 [Cucumispora dikerogammari]
MSKTPNKYVLNFPKEFQLIPNRELYCRICNKIVKSERKCNVDKHRKSKAHLVHSHSEPPQQLFLNEQKDDTLDSLITGAISAEIPFHKLRDKNLKAFFHKINYILSSETKIRQYFNNIFIKEKLDEIKEKFLNKEFS